MEYKDMQITCNHLAFTIGANLRTGRQIDRQQFFTIPFVNPLAKRSFIPSQ